MPKGIRVVSISAESQGGSVAAVASIKKGIVPSLDISMVDVFVCIYIHVQ